MQSSTSDANCLARSSISLSRSRFIASAVDRFNTSPSASDGLQCDVSCWNRKSLDQVFPHNRYIYSMSSLKIGGKFHDAAVRLACIHMKSATRSESVIPIFQELMVNASMLRIFSVFSISVSFLHLTTITISHNASRVCEPPSKHENIKMGFMHPGR